MNELWREIATLEERMQVAGFDKAIADMEQRLKDVRAVRRRTISRILARRRRESNHV